MTTEQATLIVENYNLLYKFAHKYHLSLDEWEGILALAWCEAIEKFDTERGQFSTFSFTVFKRAYLFEKRRRFALTRTAEREACSGDTVFIQNDNGTNITLFDTLEDNSKNTEFSCIFNTIMSYIKDNKETRYKVMYDHLLGYTQKELCDKYKITQPTVCRHIKKCQKELKLLFGGI